MPLIIKPLSGNNLQEQVLAFYDKSFKGVEFIIPGINKTLVNEENEKILGKFIFVDINGMKQTAFIIPLVNEDGTPLVYEHESINQVFGFPIYGNDGILKKKDNKYLFNKFTDLILQTPSITVLIKNHKNGKCKLINNAILDTGCTITSLHSSIVNELELDQVGIDEMGVSTASGIEKTKVYSCILEIPFLYNKNNRNISLVNDEGLELKKISWKKYFRVHSLSSKSKVPILLGMDLIALGSFTIVGGIFTFSI